MNTKPFNILLIEDSIEDADLIQSTFEESTLQPRIAIVTDGQVALDYLYKKDAYNEVENPDLIILDLNLPKKNGHEILLKIKEDPQLKLIPVVILTTSRSPSDILKSYKNYANCYICKPLNYDGFKGVIQEIENFWLSTVQLPDVYPGGAL